jgi:hypothetical protein
VAVFPEHVIDIPAALVLASADEVVAADVGSDKLAELFLPLPLQTRHPNAATGRIFWQIALHRREQLPALVDDVVERIALWKKRDGVPAAKSCHPWDRCHASETRMSFSHNTVASSTLKFIGR